MNNLFNNSLIYGVYIMFIISFSIHVNAQTITRFATIGDFGDAGTEEEDVANLINSWGVDFIITLGDNNYPDGAASTIDENIGQYYHQYIYPYVGSYGSGSSDGNRFFPSLGNHDWHTNPPQPHYDYFELPNNERYYEFEWGDIHFFAIDSDSDEPDGVTENSTQGQWLYNALSASTSVWNVVYFHHPPYSSGSHGSNGYMQWPFKEWGANVVMSGHDHTYERIILDDFPYFVNGLGGRSIYSFGSPVPGSEVRYNDDYGAMLVEADAESMTFKFYSRANELVDTYTIYSSPSDVEPQIVNSFRLEQNYPNPFNPTTRIQYTIIGNQFVSLKVFDVLGNEVESLVNEEKPEGTYKIEFDANNLKSGVYFYTLTVGSQNGHAFTQTNKMVLLR